MTSRTNDGSILDLRLTGPVARKRRDASLAPAHLVERVARPARELGPRTVTILETRPALGW